MAKNVNINLFNELNEATKVEVKKKVLMESDGVKTIEEATDIVTGDLSKDVLGAEADKRNAQYEKDYEKDLQYVKDIMAGRTVIDDKYHEELDLDTAKKWLRKDYIYLNNLLSADPDEIDKKLAEDLPEIFGNKVEEAAPINSDLKKGKEERLASLKTQLEQDGDQLADDEKAAIEEEIAKLEGEVYSDETNLDEAEEIEELFVYIGIEIPEELKEFLVDMPGVLDLPSGNKIFTLNKELTGEEKTNYGLRLFPNEATEEEHKELFNINESSLNEEVSGDVIERLKHGDDVYFRDENGQALMCHYSENYQDPEDYDDGYKPEYGGSEEALVAAKEAAENREVWEFVEIDEETLEPTGTIYGYAYGEQELRDNVDLLREVKVIKKLEENDNSNLTIDEKVARLKLMDQAARSINDEDIIDYWLTYGVPDEESDDGFFDDAEDYDRLEKVFIAVMKEAIENGLYECPPEAFKLAKEYVPELENITESEEPKEAKIVETEVKGLKEVKSQGNVFMLEDETNKFIVGENYNRDEGLIESAEIYDNKEEADADYLKRCDITRDGEKLTEAEELKFTPADEDDINTVYKYYPNATEEQAKKIIDLWNNEQDAINYSTEPEDFYSTIDAWLKISSKNGYSLDDMILG